MTFSVILRVTLPPLPRRQQAAVRGVDVFTEAGEDDLLELAGHRTHFAHSDLRRRLDRVTVDSATDGRKGDGADPMRECHLQAAPIARGQKIRFAPRPAAPYRTHGVDDVPGREPVTARDLRITRRAAAEQTAFGEQLRTGGTMDRTVDTSSAEEGRIGGVDDGVDGERGDVGLTRFEHGLVASC